MDNHVENYDYKGYQIEIFYDECPDSPRNWDNVFTIACWHRDYHKLGDVDSREYKNPEDYLRHLVRMHVPESEVVKWAHTNGKTEKNTIRLKYNRSTREWDLHVYCRYGVPGLFMSDPYWDVQGSFATKEGAYEDIMYIIHENACMELLEKYLYIVPISVYEHSAIKIYAGSPCCQWDSGQVGFAYVVRKDYASEKNFEEWADKCIDGECETYTRYLNGWVYGLVITKLDEEGEMTNEEVENGWGFYEDSDKMEDYAKKLIDDLVA